AVQRSAASGPAVQRLESGTAHIGAGQVQLPAHLEPPADGASTGGLSTPEFAPVAQRNNLQLATRAPDTGGVRADRATAPGVGAAFVQRLALPLPRRPKASFPSEAVPAAEPLLASDAAAPAPAATISREVLPETSHPPAASLPDATEAAQSAPGAAGASTSTVAAVSSEQLDELAKGLYDKIRARLKAELRLDRERCGRVSDLAR
ncbi:MAG: hypothetical protein QOJ23_5690, partial [Actinomycetota bacterium]|nr:hypothetical protein [Actinomycetota bacterium]